MTPTRSMEGLRGRLSQAILVAVRDGATTGPLLVEEADNLADAVLTALYPNGHEDTPEHWRANVADEKRKKHHVSGLLSKALLERDEARSILNDLLLTRQAQEDACGEHFDLLLADDGSPEDAQRCEEACGREAKATVAHLAAWDRARSLLAGEEKRTDLLARVHERLGGGVDIQTFSDGTVEVRWKRLYGDELSDERYASAGSIPDVLAAILCHEDGADTAEEKG